jgi:hypothetical protein
LIASGDHVLHSVRALVPRSVRGPLDLRVVAGDVGDQFVADCDLGPVFIDACDNVSCAVAAHAPISGTILLHRLRCQLAELVFDLNQVALEQIRP